MLYATLLWLLIVLLLLVNGVGVLMVVFQLPGTWLILTATGLMAWWRWDPIGSGSVGQIGVGMLITLVGLAVLGEIVEFIAGAWGARRAGASRRAAIIATMMAVIGAVFGTILIPIPIIGTLLGAAIGAGLGSALGDMWAGRHWEMAVKGAYGAAIGRFWGALGKVAIATVMWIMVTAAVFIP